MTHGFTPDEQAYLRHVCQRLEPYADEPQDDDTDQLLAIKGIVAGTCISIAFWIVVGAAVWVAV